MNRQIVIVDDQIEVRRLLSSIFEAKGNSTKCFENGDDAIAHVTAYSHDIDLVILDLDLGANSPDGLEVCRQITEQGKDVPVIMLTGHGTTEDAVEAFKAGAIDFITKDPYMEDNIDLSTKKVERLWAHVHERQRLEGEVASLTKKHEELQASLNQRWKIVGDSPQIKETLKRVQLVARVPRPVLVLGERGTGKELVARAIHNLSDRANRPYITINCAAVAESLLESELFGHEAGAFTGATSQKEGKFELADGGTLFLDEIGNMSMDFQAKILRVIEYQRFERVAGRESLQVDVRVIAATNADLEKNMREGSFREDLYDRLAFEVIRLPALRERVTDVPLLAEYFLARFAAEVGLSVTHFSADAIKVLVGYSFPGNVREFKNVVERAAYSADGSEVTKSDVLRALPQSTAPAAEYQDNTELPLDKRVEAYERSLCLQSLVNSGFNQKEAAESLKITYDQFRQRYRKYDLGKEKK